MPRIDRSLTGMRTNQLACLQQVGVLNGATLWNQAWHGLLQVGVCASGPSSSTRSRCPAVVFGAALGSLSVPVHPEWESQLGCSRVECYAAGKRNHCHLWIKRTSLACC